MNEKYTIRVINETIPIDLEKKWEHFLGNNSEISFFQSSDYISIFKGCISYKPLILFAESIQKEVVGTLLAMIISDRIHSIPFQRLLIIGGPVISMTNPDRTYILDLLLECLKKRIPKETVFVEIRNLKNWESDAQVFEKKGFVWHDHLNDILQIKSGREVFLNVKPSKQRQIRRGLENGAVIRPAENITEVIELYNQLHGLYKKSVKKPIPPFLVFKNFYHKLHLENKGVIMVVKYRDKVIGGMVCPFSGVHTVYEWYICSLKDKYKQLYPGVLATWAGIDHSIKNNFQYFDFMGMGSPHMPYGVRDFKTQFGGEVINFGRWQYINNKPLYKLGLIGYKLLKRFL